MGCSDKVAPRAVAPASGSSASGAASSSGAPAVAQPGAVDAGDPYFPGLGNGGYDVTHYDLALDIDPKANTLAGTATITATATQALSRFDLDLTGLDVESVTVDGQAAPFTRDARELVITPAHPVAAQAAFTTVVAYHGSPEPRTTKAIPIAVGWIATGDATFALNEPEGASTWYPVNDHPSDKAAYTFHITAAGGLTAVANGDLVSTTPLGDGRSVWTYDEAEPMASYLVQVAVGDFQLSTAPGPDGVTIRNAFATPLAAEATVDFSRTPEMLRLFAGEFGPYPFNAYGALVVNERTQYALETQTLSLFDSSFVDGNVGDDAVVAHELAHQWFGDSVTPSTWKDVWLCEGFATYAEWLWEDHLGTATVAANARAAHDRLAQRGGEVLTGDPGVAGMFDFGAVYVRGALTLQALRSTVGDDAFFTTLRTYTSRFAGRNATTADFVAVASEVAQRDLRDLFDAWLYRAPLPALPS